MIFGQGGFERDLSCSTLVKKQEFQLLLKKIKGDSSMMELVRSLPAQRSQDDPKELLREVSGWYYEGIIKNALSQFTLVDMADVVNQSAANQLRQEPNPAADPPDFQRKHFSKTPEGPICNFCAICGVEDTCSFNFHGSD